MASALAWCAYDDAEQNQRDDESLGLYTSLVADGKAAVSLSGVFPDLSGEGLDSEDTGRLVLYILQELPPTRRHTHGRE